MNDVLVIGAGPAGMAAALALQSKGLRVTVADDQPGPGGRIFTGIETREAHGREDRSGAVLAAQFRQAGGSYLPETEVWQIEAGPKVFLSRAGCASLIEPEYVLLASGAQERPMPFPGWQLPGVMTVGAAQILLKTAKQIPDVPVWLAGSGPLFMLYAHQLIAAGGEIAGILDTTPERRARAAAGFMPGAIAFGLRDMMRGVGWLVGQRVRRLPIVRNVGAIEAHGADKLERISYRTRGGRRGEASASLLLIHDGVVPNTHATMSAGCEHRWNDVQHCFEPILDSFGQSSVPSIFVAGDGATIAGARAAVISGRLAAVGVARAAGRLSEQAAEEEAAPLRRSLLSAAQFRRFIDALYPPVELPIPDATIVCRCEEVTARQIREVLEGREKLGPDGVKIATRAGMGPCQGRQCGLSMSRLIRERHGGSPQEVGFLRIRPPLKPLTLGELASLETAC